MPEQDLDSRIRELVARAVADAPRAPELDPGVVPLHGRRRDPRRGWWVGAGAALVAAAAAITTVVLVGDTDDRISTPNTQPSTGPSVPTVPTNTSVPPAPSTPTPTAVPAASDGPTILTAGLDGVVERRGEEVRTLTTEPASIALATPDGRIVVQQATGEGNDRPVVLGVADGSISELFGTADWDGLVRMHDVELVGGRQLLLVSLVLGSDQPDTSTEAIYVVDLATAERTELHAGVGSVRSRLTMAPSGLVVGEVAEDAGVSFLALAVPGSPAAQQPLPTAEQLGLQTTYPGCDVDCPRMYTVLPDGATFAWIEGFDQASIVSTVGDRIPLPFPPQGTSLDVAADGSFLVTRSQPDVRAVRVARDGSVTELEGTIATAGPGGSTESQAPPAFEVTERDFVAAAGPNGVVLRTAAGDLARRLDRPASVALPVGDGRVVVQLDEAVPSMWLPDGSVEELFSTTDAVGPIHAQDVAIVEGRPVLLYVAEGAPGEPAMVGGLDLLTDETRDIAPLPGSFDETYRLHLGANGLVVGNTGSGLFVTSWPDTPAATLVIHLDEQTMGSDPSVYTVSPDGTWVAQLEADGVVEKDVTPDGLGEPRRLVLPFDTTGAVDVDVSADGVIVNFGSGQDARYARRDGSFGVLEGPVGVQGPGTTATGASDPAPAATTTTPTTTVPAVDNTDAMVMAGSGGIAVFHDGIEVRRLDQPAEVASLTPGGAVIFQPPRPDRGGEPGDPLIWRPDGTVDRLLGELPANQSYRLYDVADVAGVPTVLYGLRTRPESGDPAGYTEVLNALAMAPGGWTTVELTQVGTYEAGFNGLSLSAEGIVLGTYGESVTSSLFAMAIPGSPAAGDGVPDAASLGLEPSYGDCSDCPGQYTISADSRTIAWLDSGDVIVFDVETGETRRFQHPALAGFPVRLDIRATGNDAYDVIVGQWSNTDATPIDAALFSLTPGGGGSELPLGTEFASFAP